MPNIRTYQPNQQAPTPNNMAATSAGFAAGALRQDLTSEGQAIGQGINKAGQAYVDHEVQAETSDLTAKYAQTFEQLTQSWNDTAKTADPNDPNTGQRWREDVMQPALDQLNEGFHTDQAKERAQRLSAQLSAHMFEKTTADQSTIAGNAAVSNVETMINSYSNAVQADPTAMRGAMPMLQESIEQVIASHPNLSSDQVSALRTRLLDGGKAQIAKSAALGMIDRNPDLFRQAAAAGQFDKYLDASDIKTLDSYADSQQRAALAAQRAQEAEVRRQQTEAVTARANQVFANTVDPNTGQIHITPDFYKETAKIAVMPNAPSGLGRAMYNFGIQKEKEEAAGIPAVTDPHTYQDFSQRMFLPSGDPHALTLADVYEARAEQKLSDKDFQFYKGAVESAKKDPQAVADQKMLQNFFTQYKSTITKTNPFLKNYDAPGDQRFYQFQVDKQAQFAAGLKAGKTAQDLLDPTSKDFIGRNIGDYTFTKEQGQALMMENVLSGKSGVVAPVNENEPPKRLPGESATDYLKRVGTGG